MRSRDLGLGIREWSVGRQVRRHGGRSMQVGALAPLSPRGKRRRALVGCRWQPTLSGARAKRRRAGGEGADARGEVSPPLPNPSPSRGEGLEVRRLSDTGVSPSNAKIRSVRSDSRAPLSPRGRGARCVALFRYRRPGFARSIELRRLVRDAVVAKRGTRFGWGAFARPVAPRAGTRAGDILFAACAMMRGPEDH